MSLTDKHKRVSDRIVKARTERSATKKAYLIIGNQSGEILKIRPENK